MPGADAPGGREADPGQPTPAPHAGARPRRLGWLAPAVLAAWLALDVGLRLAPPAWFGVNPFSDALRRPARGASFAPNFTAVADHYVGDAVREANAVPTESRPPMRVTFDARGFRRNPLLAPGQPPDVLLLGGASFGFGAALSDEETLPAAITRRSGLGMYNGGLAGEDALTIRRVDRLLAGLPGRPRTALLLIVEHENLAPPPRGRGRVAALVAAWPALGPAVDRGRALRRGVAEARRQVGRRWGYSPLDIVTGRLFRHLSDGRVLPNSYARGTRTLTLPDGRPMYVRHYELAPAEQGRGPADAGPVAEYVGGWRDSLAARGIATRVLLVPSRYTVYGPELEPGAGRAAALQVGAYLDRLAGDLRARGIPTVNALPVFRAAAPEELRTGVLSFYREDNHWNARGVERIARVVADSLLAWDARPAAPTVSRPAE